MLLQANDFRVLHERYGCELQVGGSDQWGNITAGVDLIRRTTGDRAFALTAPLITRADGQKFGKSQGGNIWLDPEATSAYQLYQYFMGMADADVERFLLQLTLLPVEECAEIAAAHAAEPRRRLGQRRLAAEVVALIHGADQVGPVQGATDVVFGGGEEPGAEAYELLRQEIPTSVHSLAELTGGDTRGEIDALALMAAAFDSSKGQVRKNLGGHYVNGVSLEHSGRIAPSDLRHGSYLLLRRGKATHHLAVVEA